MMLGVLISNPYPQLSPIFRPGGKDYNYIFRDGQALCCMRESNFRSASSNRASVSITSTFYDRRALDCTSDRPLINSLNYLAFLTASSARVRETMCMDGGVERLIDILKRCRTTECASYATAEPALVAWKWSLALQCLFFLGTRGTESIRCRLVEAGVIPVVCTVLDNYLDAKYDSSEVDFAWEDLQSSVALRRFRTQIMEPGIGSGGASALSAGPESESNLDIATSDFGPEYPRGSVSDAESGVSGLSDMNGLGLHSEDTDNNRQLGDLDATLPVNTSNRLSATDIPSVWTSLRSGESSATLSARDTSSARAESFLSQLGLTSVARQSTGAARVDGNVPSRLPVTTVSNFGVQAHQNSIPSGVVFNPPRSFCGCALVPREEDVIWSLEILAFVSKYAYLKPHLQNTHIVPRISIRSECQQAAENSRALDSILLGMELDDSKVRKKQSLENIYYSYQFDNDYDYDPEFFCERQNLFSLVERFTALKQPREIPYWAGIIMRNSCRKDERRGGVRQCANFNCGKWEEYPRQFAKCRRCRRTKYCSKQCQLDAWAFHRYWCASSNSSTYSSVSATSVSAASASASTANAAETINNLGANSVARMANTVPSAVEFSAEDGSLRPQSAGHPAEVEME